MRTLTINYVKSKAKETSSFVERAILAYNAKYPNDDKKLVRKGTRRLRKKGKQKALDGFSLK